MDDELIDSERIPLSRRSLVPGEGFFYPDSLDEEREEERIAEACEGADAVVVTDSDADGLGCLALVREAYGAAVDPAAFEAYRARRLAGEELDEDEAHPADAAREDSPVALVASGPHSLVDDLEYVAEYVEQGADLFVCDICPDDFEGVADSLTTLVNRCETVRWFDHHQWDDDVAETVRAAGVTLVVGDSEEECTTDVALRSLEYDFPARFRELAAVTRDHDLWLKDDERSDDLSDYAHWADKEEYAAVVGAYGVDLPEVVQDYVAHRRVEKENLIGKAVDRAVMREVGDWTVGVTYGRCSQNEVAESLRLEGADAAVVVKPAGSASIRGSEGFERCHEVAAQVNGGGHPKAAGCKPDIYDDVLDYAQHWTTEGQAAKKVILRAFESLVEEGGEDGDADDGAGEDETADDDAAAGDEESA